MGNVVFDDEPIRLAHNDKSKPKKLAVIPYWFSIKMHRYSADIEMKAQNAGFEGVLFDREADPVFAEITAFNQKRFLRSFKNMFAGGFDHKANGNQNPYPNPVFLPPVERVGHG